MMQSVVLKSSLRTFVLTILILALVPAGTSVKCTPNGFFCASFTRFQMCLLGSGDNVPLSDIYDCPAGTVCSDNCNSILPCTVEACPVTCTTTNSQPIPGVSHSYYNCVVGPMGEVTVTVVPCPKGTFFNVTSRSCRALTSSTSTTEVATTSGTTTTPATTPPVSTTSATTTDVTSTPATTTSTSPAPTTTHTTPKPFTCTKKGRFPNRTDCNKYFFCSDNLDGSFTKYDYSCPKLTFFNAAKLICSYDETTCVTR